MERPPGRGLHSSDNRLAHFAQEGLSLIAVIGVLAVITIGLSLVTPALVHIWDRQHQETEGLQLHLIADGIHTYLEQNKAFPPSLASLAPDHVTFSAAQLTTNARGFPRYYAVHPAMVGLNNSTGLSAAELVDTRFLLITNLIQDAAPTITTPAEFETWWTTDESLIPNLHIHRGNVGHLFYSLAITPRL
jgi:type II secretory pathway pseudopilin PulG